MRALVGRKVIVADNEVALVDVDRDGEHALVHNLPLASVSLI